MRIYRLDFDKGVEIKSRCGWYQLKVCEEQKTTQDGVNRYQCEGEKVPSGPGTTTADVLINSAQSVFNKLFLFLITTPLYFIITFLFI